MFLFRPFQKLKLNSLNNYDLRKDVYMEQINDMKQKQKIIVYNFNASNYFDIEWDNSEPQVKEYNKTSSNKWMENSK